MKARWLLAAMVVGSVLVVPGQDRYRAEQDFASGSVESGKPASANSGQTQRNGFLSFHSDAAYPFSPMIGSNPERICDRLDEAGFANLGWRSSEVADTWECMARIDEANAAEGAKSNSIFYMLRGTASRRITYARMKINVPGAATSAQTLADAQNFIRTFGTSTGFDVPRDLLDAISNRTPTAIVLRDVSFKLKPEFNDPDRLNLSIEFGPTLDAFYRLRPNSVPVWDNGTPAKPADEKGSRVGEAN